jgi:hypothetical protein
MSLQRNTSYFIDFEPNFVNYDIELLLTKRFLDMSFPGCFQFLFNFVFLFLRNWTWLNLGEVNRLIYRSLNHLVPFNIKLGILNNLHQVDVFRPTRKLLVKIQSVRQVLIFLSERSRPFFISTCSYDIVHQVDEQRFYLKPCRIHCPLQFRLLSLSHDS